MILSITSKGEEVKRLQTILNGLGYRTTKGAMLADDGSFGPATLEVVNIFKDLILPGGNQGEWRGLVGDTTWDALKEAKPILTPQLWWLPPFDLNEGGKPWSDKDKQEFIQFDYGTERFNMSWDGCTPTLMAIKKAFEIAIAKRGWKASYNSAYRPMIYQSHFWDIQNGAASKTTLGKAHAKSPHALSSLVSKPSKSSPHIAGIAWDCIVTDGYGRALNSMTSINSDLLNLILSLGLKKPPVNDCIHFQLA